MNTLSTRMLIVVGTLIAAAGCVVEMHPADSTPAASAAPAAAPPAPAAPATAQPVQVVSGPSGINPPIRNRQTVPTTTATDTSTATSTTTATSTATGATQSTGASAALK